MTEEELEASIDVKEEGEIDWTTVQGGIPLEQAIQIDDDVLAWFKEQGSGYQTRMNQVLRSYMDAQDSRDDKANDTDRKAS